MAAVVLLARQHVEFEDHVGDRHQVAGKMGRVQIAEIGVAHHQVGEGIGLQQVEQVHALRAAQIVESVAVLQMLQLVFEDEVERRAELAAELVEFFGEAADPEIDVVEAAGLSSCGPAPVRRIDAGGVQEIETVGRRLNRVRHHRRIHVGIGRHVLVGAEHDRHGGGALAFRCGLGGDQRMGAVGGDEVDDRQRMLDVLGEIDPARVRLDVGRAGHRVDLGACVVEARNAGIAAAGDIERGKIERQSEQIVAQRLDDELVDLVAHLRDMPRISAPVAALVIRRRRR